MKKLGSKKWEKIEDRKTGVKLQIRKIDDKTHHIMPTNLLLRPTPDPSAPVPSTNTASNVYNSSSDDGRNNETVAAICIAVTSIIISLLSLACAAILIRAQRRSTKPMGQQLVDANMQPTTDAIDLNSTSKNV